MTRLGQITQHQILQLCGYGCSPSLVQTPLLIKEWAFSFLQVRYVAIRGHSLGLYFDLPMTSSGTQPCCCFYSVCAQWAEEICGHRDGLSPLSPRNIGMLDSNPRCYDSSKLCTL